MTKKRKLDLTKVEVDDKALATARKMLAKAVHSDITNNSDDKMSMINTQYDRIKELREKTTHVQFVIDSSASMSCVRSKVVQAYNELLKRQARHPGGSTFGFKTFHQEILPEQLTNPKYLERLNCKGSTPLFDTIGRTIRMIENRLPGNNDIVFIIITDGKDTGQMYDNNEHFYPVEKVLKPLIEEKQRLGWQFLYCGKSYSYASLATAANKLGITFNNTTDFNDYNKLLLNVNKMILAYRQGDIKKLSFKGE